MPTLFSIIKTPPLKSLLEHCLLNVDKGIALTPAFYQPISPKDGDNYMRRNTVKVMGQTHGPLKPRHLIEDYRMSPVIYTLSPPHSQRPRITTVDYTLKNDKL